MVSGDLPAVARRRLRIALRGWREAAELTQGEVAAALDWSLSKVQRIESGEVTLSGSDLRALLDTLCINDQTAIDQLVKDARIARRRVSGWWDQAKYKTHLTPAMLQLLQFESQATTIRAFASTILPGVLQTRSVADAVLRFWSADLNEMPDEQWEVRLETRVLRNKHLFDKPDRPAYLLLLDESLLYREIAGPAVTLEQLQHLLDHLVERKVTLRIAPYRSPAGVAMLGPFAVLDFGAEEDGVLYRESWLRDEIVYDAAAVSRHRRLFDEIWRRSYAEERSMRLLEARITVLHAAG